MTLATPARLSKTGNLSRLTSERSAPGDGQAPAVPPEVYRSLAAFRVEIRRFFAFSKQAIEAVGLPPVQYQAMLAIKAHDGEMGVSDLARELFIEVNSAVELARRLETAALVTRARSAIDKRRVVLALTPHADTQLAALASVHLDTLQVRVPEFLAILTGIAALPAVSFLQDFL